MHIHKIPVIYCVYVKNVVSCLGFSFVLFLILSISYMKKGQVVQWLLGNSQLDSISQL